MPDKSNLIKNGTKGYGYNYASLSDIAKQGIEILKMKTGTDEISKKEYIYYFDTDIKDWIRGSEIVIPENIVNKEGKAKMNAAQLYGSAITYARRITEQLALGLVCSDDVEIENAQQLVDVQDDNGFNKIHDIQLEIIKQNGKLVAEELKLRGVVTPNDLSKLTIEDASELCKLINERTAK